MTVQGEAAVTQGQQHKAAGERLRHFITEYRRFRGLDSDIVYSLHAPPDPRAADLLVSDLALAVGALTGAPQAKPMQLRVEFYCHDCWSWNKHHEFHEQVDGPEIGTDEWNNFSTAVAHLRDYPQHEMRMRVVVVEDSAPQPATTNGEVP